jgi:uncharacterized protein (TIGR02246 family)
MVVTPGAGVIGFRPKLCWLNASQALDLSAKKRSVLAMATTPNSIDLTIDVEERGQLYVEAFNSGDLDAINQMYTEDAVSVWKPGNPVTGKARKAALAELISRKPKMTATLRESHVTGDTALLVVDWTIEIPTPEGGEHLKGVGLDVLRLGADGQWRFAIDNPFGEGS